jgi:hypothetical protein
VKTSAFDMQMNPGSPGLQLHRIDASKDPNFWSLRVNRDIRIIVHNTAQSFLLAYVGHHDDAYKWAERRRIEVHPKTGAIQIVEVRERIEEITPQRPYQHVFDHDIREEVPPSQPSSKQSVTSDLPLPQPFLKLSQDDLLSIGMPEDWIFNILIATEDQFLDLATHLPAETSEVLLEYVSTGTLKIPAPVTVSDPYAHPDALRRIECRATGAGPIILMGALDCFPASLPASHRRTYVFWSGPSVGVRWHGQDCGCDPPRSSAR